MKSLVRFAILALALITSLAAVAQTAPSIDTFDPVIGAAGTTVTITGSNFSTATGVHFNFTPGVFRIVSDQQIEATVPMFATTGSIIVENPDGRATSAAIFTVLQPPVVGGFTPSMGKAGDTVTINGINLSSATEVRFNGVMATFTIDRLDIVATVPEEATSGPIAVTNPDGTATSVQPFTVQPNVTNFSPAAGTVGSTVTIHGSGFSDVRSVKFNFVDAVFTVVAPTAIEALVPSGARTGRIGVTTAAGTALSATDFVVQPKITSFSPISGTSGISVTINGSGFTGTVSVKFGAVDAPFLFINDALVRAVVPATAITGKISVATADGTATSSTDFTVLKPPTITSFTPAFGTVGASVTITGMNLSDVTEVKFGGTPVVVPIVVLTATSIRAIVPLGAMTGKISVTNGDGTAQSSTNFTVQPKITSFTPTSGKSGDSVTISGTNFTGAVSVKFGVVDAPFVFVNDAQIEANVPATAVTGKISVTTPDGTATSLTDFTVLKPPTIASFTPAIGAVGATVTITGTNLSDVTEVKFGGVSVVDPIVVVTATSIKVNVPAGAVTGKISVTNSAGTAQSVGIFKILPKVVSFTPTSGQVGETVTITGSNFTGATSVEFGPVASSFTVVNDTQITATVPSTAVTGKISVTTPDGTGISGVNFTVLKPPTIASFTPAIGAVGATVTITGTNLSDVTDVKFGGTSVVDPIVVVTATSIKVNVPPGAVTGKISVTNPAGTAVSVGVFKVLPKVVSFTPTSGQVGETVTITGSNFTGATSVKFGAVIAPFALVNDSQITATVPPTAITGKISVTTPDGTGTSSLDFIVLKPPVITSFTPAIGMVGTLVTITGTNLSGVTTVKFNGVTASFMILNAASLRATVPAGATTGPISVTNDTGTDTSATSFHVLLPALEQIDRITGMVRALGLPRGQETAFMAKIDAVAKHVGRANGQPCGPLQALINYMQAPGSKLPRDSMPHVMEAVDDLRIVLGCG